eukprot:scpid98945/ scgid27106/ Mannose-P-dolichol utilization defect 1 protein homolog
MDVLAVSKLLGIVTIVMCSVMKLPQLWLIFRSKKARGISLSSLSLELFCYTVGSLYGFRSGYPLTTYGESVLLLVQNAGLHALVIYYEGMMSQLIAFVALSYVVCVTVTVSGILPLTALQLIFSFLLPIVIMSKVQQIRSLMSAGTAGQVSLSTWCIALTGCIFRIFTTLVETQDKMVLANFCVGTVLNGVVVAMIILYQYRDAQWERTRHVKKSE